MNNDNLDEIPPSPESWFPPNEMITDGGGSGLSPIVFILIFLLIIFSK